VVTLIDIKNNRTMHICLPLQLMMLSPYFTASGSSFLPQKPKIHVHDESSRSRIGIEQPVLRSTR
jgi:hypothetical protein